MTTNKELAERFQDRGPKLMERTREFRRAVEAGTLGDHSEAGFLMELLLILQSEED